MGIGRLLRIEYRDSEIARRVHEAVSPSRCTVRVNSHAGHDDIHGHHEFMGRERRITLFGRYSFNAGYVTESFESPRLRRYTF